MHAFTRTLCFLSILTGCAAAPVSASATTESPQPTDAAAEPTAATTTTTTASHELDAGRLRVAGRGIESVTPDLARISLSIDSIARKADTAVDDNADATRRVLDELASLGIAKADMQTSGYDVMPSWERRGQTEVHTTIDVTVRDLAKLGKVLRASTDAGATTTHGIEFDISDREAREKAAMTAAVADARARGEALAGAAGRKLGEVVSIDTVVAPATTTWLEEADEATAVPVAPGSFDVRVDVTVAFVLEA